MEVFKMVNYKSLYTTLFGAVEDAIVHMEQDDHGLALRRLISAQLDAEETWVDMEE